MNKPRDQDVAALTPGEWEQTLGAIRQRIQSAKSYIATFDALGGRLGNELVHDVIALLDRLAAVEKAQEVLSGANIAYANEVVTLQAKLAVCEKQWAFAKSHDSELDHVARIQQLEAKLAACDDVVPRTRYDAVNTDWLQAKEKLKTVQNSACIEIESLREKLAACEAELTTGNQLYARLTDKQNDTEAKLAVAVQQAKSAEYNFAVEHTALHQAEEKLAACENDAGLVEERRQFNEKIGHLEAKLERAERALNDIIIRAKRIREDKAVVGIEASFIEQKAKQALKETQGGAR